MNEVIRALKERRVSGLTGQSRSGKRTSANFWRPLPMPQRHGGPAEILVAVQDPATIAACLS